MSERNSLLKEVQALDFALFDASLFLNVNTDNKKALKYYNHYQKLAADARNKFQRKYGPLTHHTDGDMDSWRWAEGPWPWEFEGGKV